MNLPEKRGFLHQLLPDSPPIKDSEPIPHAKDKEPVVKIGTKITHKFTGQEKTIERIETVGANHLVYITTDGTRYNNASLILAWHWTQ